MSAWHEGWLDRRIHAGYVYDFFEDRCEVRKVEPGVREWPKVGAFPPTQAVKDYSRGGFEEVCRVVGGRRSDGPLAGWVKREERLERIEAYLRERGAKL